MSAPHPRYSKEEFARRGSQLYDTIRPKVEVGNAGRIVAIDIETGQFEVADTGLIAAKRLLAVNSNAQPWCTRIDGGPVRRFGMSMRALHSTERME